MTPPGKQNTPASALAAPVQEIAEKARRELQRRAKSEEDTLSDSEVEAIISSAIAAATKEQWVWGEAWRLVAKGKEGAYVAMEGELAHVKGELAYMKLQRDALLEITWLDLPDEPSESIAKWREQFNNGWQRKAEVAASLEAQKKQGPTVSELMTWLKAEAALMEIEKCAAAALEPAQAAPYEGDVAP